MKHLLIGLRNLLRNTRRTFISMLLISFGVAGLMIYGGYIDYTMKMFREATITNNLGHIQVYQKGFNDNLEKEDYTLDYLVDEPEDKISLLKRFPYVREVTGRLTFRGLISNGDRTDTCMVFGGYPEAEKSFTLGLSIIEGNPLESNDMDKIVIGKTLAKRLNAKVGSLLTIMTTTKFGNLNAHDFTVKGIMETGTQLYNGIRVNMHISKVQELLSVKGVERFMILLQNTGKTEEIQKKIETVIAKKELKLETRNWDDLAEYYKKTKKVFDRFLLITGLILIVVVIFSIMNMMSMVIFERMREIGTIKALGLPRKGVLLMLFSESLWLGIIGAGIGILLSFIIGFIINVSGGILMEAGPGFTKDYYTLIEPDGYRYLQVLLMSMISVAIGVIMPAVKSSRIRIVEALRYI